MDPQRRVDRVSRAEDRDAEVGDCQQRAPDRVRMPRAGIEVVSLDKQERKAGPVSNPAHLRPQTPTSERAMQIRDRLPLNQNAPGNAVTACRERLDRHLRPETQKRGRDSAPALKDIRHDHSNRSALFPVHEPYTKQ